MDQGDSSLLPRVRECRGRQQERAVFCEERIIVINFEAQQVSISVNSCHSLSLWSGSSPLCEFHFCNITVFNGRITCPMLSPSAPICPSNKEWIKCVWISGIIFHNLAWLVCGWICKNMNSPYLIKRTRTVIAVILLPRFGRPRFKWEERETIDQLV